MTEPQAPYLSGRDTADEANRTHITVEEYRALLAEERERKYRNKPTMIDGHYFDSQAEAKRYGELRLLEREGKVRDLTLQPRWVLMVNGVRIGTYTGDFAFTDRDTGRLVVEDVKGAESRDYVLRKKLMLACHGIAIQEIRA